MTEEFTFVRLSARGYTIEKRFMIRRFADKLFDEMISAAIAHATPSPVRDVETADTVSVIAYYCASVGGQVNEWRA